MSDEVWTRREPQSPCVKICVIHPESKLCTGCHRTITEIGMWSRMSWDERQEVLDALPERAATHHPRRRGGRRRRMAATGT
ncbi:MAG: DUF1289 domain-containing protein [Pseudomonadota bacterium]